MGKIVFAAALSHAPGITAFADAPPLKQKQSLYSAMERVRRLLKQSAPDLLIVVSSDHFTNLSMNAMPAFCVGTSDDYTGPVENWINIDSRKVPGSSAYSKAIIRGAFASGFDPAFAEDMRLEHGVMVPLHFLTPAMDVPIVPVLQNCVAPPLPTLRRCYQMGQVFAAVAAHREERVAIIGTGGLSHAPGAPEAGRIDEEFDRRFLHLLEEGRADEATALSDSEIDAAGFGTWEIRQWLTVAGATGGHRASVLAYEPIKEWDTGCGVVVFDC